MSYIINNSRGNVVAIVPDGTANTTAIPITLVGRGVTAYGTVENENYVWILENFASGAAPVNPMQGQFWYNTNTDIVSTYSTSNAWIAISTQAYANSVAASSLVNPELTGNATAPTASTSTNDTIIATTAFVRNAINTYSNVGNLIGSTMANSVVYSNLTTVGTLVSLSVTGNTNSGNLKTAGQVSATGNITGGNILAGGIIYATGNIIGGNLSGTSITGTLITPNQTNITSVGTLTSLNVAGNVNSGNLRTTGQVSATGNITGGNVSATTYTGTTVSISGNSTAGYFIGDGSLLTNITANAIVGSYGNANVTSLMANFGSNTISTSGNITGGNLTGTLTTASQTNITSIGTLGSLSVTGNINGGNLRTIGQISASGNITGGNVSATTYTGTTVSITGTATAGYFAGDGSLLTNISAGAIVGSYGNANVTDLMANFGSNTISTSGNITGGNLTGTLITGNQPNITSVGILGSLSVTGNIAGSNVFATKYTGSTISITGTATAAFFAGDGSQLTNLNAGAIVGSYGNANVTNLMANFGSNTISTSGNITGGNLSGTNIVGTLTTASQTNITSIGALGSLSVTGNIDGGNLRTAGQVSATGNITGGNLSVGTGTITTNNIVNGGANNTGNIGSASNYFNRVFATSTTALYADLAENYAADLQYEPGTVLSIGGNEELTKSNQDGDRRVVGVVSSEPSYVMNSGLQSEFVVTVALTGRVPCLVQGTIRRGDLLVSAGNGRARAEEDPRVGSVIGKALENFDGNIGTIEIIVGKH